MRLTHPKHACFALVFKFAGFIDGKIYVIGYRYHDHRKNVMVVFDIETQTYA